MKQTLRKILLKAREKSEVLRVEWNWNDSPLTWLFLLLFVFLLSIFLSAFFQIVSHNKNSFLENLLGVIRLTLLLFGGLWFINTNKKSRIVAAFIILVFMIFDYDPDSKKMGIENIVYRNELRKFESDSVIQAAINIYKEDSLVEEENHDGGGYQ
jgi:hypothetical protein